MPSTTTHQRQRAEAVWRTCLASSFRTALACTIVGCTTLYGPASFRRQIAFPAFSYVTAILIVTDATLGDTLRGCWLGLYATLQSLGPAILTLWLIGPARLTSGTTAVAVALGGFVVALPESTHLVAKRIALGQIIIVYVVAFINGVHTEAVMHPLHVATSTALGVFACVCALLLPYPRLACCEVKKKCNLLADNASERLKLFVKAICAEDNTSALACISQAKSLNEDGKKLLRSITRHQESMKWEILPFKCLRAANNYYMKPGEKLQDIQMALRGMEMALDSTLSFPVRMLDEEIKGSLLKFEEHISLTNKKANNNWLACDSLTVPESNSEDIMKFLQTPQTIPSKLQELPSLFFIFCMKLLRTKTSPKPSTTPIENLVEKHKGPTHNASKHNDEISFFKRVWTWSSSKRRLMPAFKCSLSLGLAVLFGLIYSTPNGYWSALPVAISLAAAREPTFKVANVKAQGTVLGTVYGVFGCFVFERFLPIRFLSLLPWFLFSSFLRRSRMYGQAGGISAAIGAVLILGRTKFGPPSEFAIARITETFIGLSCSIIVELLFQPTRAASLAKIQLRKTLGTLHECLCSVSLQAGGKLSLLDNQNKLKVQVNELRNLIGEADAEPNLWFLPFHSACYGKLLGSLTKMVDLLLFGAHAVEESRKLGVPSWKETVNKLDDDLKEFKELVGSRIKCLEEISSIKSLKALDKELETNNISFDLELGKSPLPKCFRVSCSDEDETREKLLTSYIQHSGEVVEKLDGAPEGEIMEMKSQMVSCLSALGYCLTILIRESEKIEGGIRELVQWENASSHVNLGEISCKIHALYSHTDFVP